MRVQVAVALMVVAGMLSGCTSPSDEGAEEAVGVITDPKDFSDANSTGSHVHDYWQGATVKDVVDATQSSTWNTVGGSGYWRRTFVPPDETVVPQGTATINITVEWQDGSPADLYGAVSLWVKPADTVQPRYVQDIASGGTVEIPLTYEQADLPHQLLSAWEFIVQYNVSSQPYSAFFGTTHVVATAHRGLPLQPFPPHPDLWQDRTEFTFVDVTEGFVNLGYTGTGNLPRVVRAQEGTLVPPDAAFVTVDLELLASPPAPQPVGSLELQYHAADTRAWTSLGVASTVEPTMSWVIQVESGMGDGPYGNASLWQFRIYTPGTDNPTSPAAFAGGYRLTATVHKQ